MPDAIVGGTVGPSAVGRAGDGTPLDAAMGPAGEFLVSERMGRFSEMAYRGLLFTGGMVYTSINAATFATATTDATTTPIIGLWNPLSSTVNLHVLQAYLGVGMTALQATGGGPCAWTISLNSGAISTGSQGINTKTLTASSIGKFYAGTALTGKTNAQVILRGSSLGGGSALTLAFLATAVAMQTQMTIGVENIDGSIIVPPGGVLALQCAATPVAHSATSGILWAELPV